MIRLDLLGRNQPRKGRWLTGGLGLLAVAALAVAGLYWLDSHYPLLRAWNQWRAGDDPGHIVAHIDTTAPAADSLQVARRDSTPAPLPTSDSLQVVRRDSTPAPQPTADSLQVARIDTTLHINRPPVSARPDTLLASRQRPRWNDACRQILALAERLPTSILFQSLLSNAHGEYTIEGMSPSPRDIREVLLDTLRDLSSQSDLTRWRQGLRADQTVYEFTIQGHLDTLATRPLETLSPEQAGALSAQVYQWAQQSGLTLTASQDSIHIPLTDNLVQQRLKIWTTGTHVQMTSFIASFDQTDGAQLDELVLVPVYKKEESCWHQGHLYTAIDMLVQH
ncbi:MAG: hypothetical protein GKR89_25430 [Candidatus Latescibacteria bacterium]|nr:hypothetical protein [Candidatus Latescibacterota bacterium]